MADFLPAEREGLLDYELTPVIHSLEDIAEWNRLAAARGIGRRLSSEDRQRHGPLGAASRPRKSAAPFRRPPTSQLEGLMTHFASAADYAEHQTEEQIRTSNRSCASWRPRAFSPSYVHLSSTIPVAYGRRAAWGKMVRPGHAIYGYVSPVAQGNAPDAAAAR